MSKKIGRCEKRNADYFPHHVHNSKTIRLLQSKFGNDGYAVWFKILELCTHADEHLGDLKDEIDVLDFLDYALVDEITLNNIIKFLIKLGQIDEGIWIHSRKIWIQGLAENLKPLYDKRIGDVPEKPILELPDPETIVSVTETPIPDTETNKEQTSRPLPTRTTPETPQRREEKAEKRRDIRKEENSIITPPAKKPTMYKIIESIFLSKNNDNFDNYKKEGMAIKGIISKAEKRDNLDVFIQELIEKFYDLTVNGNDFWKGQPFLPSALNASGIFARVEKQIQVEVFIPNEPDYENMGDYKEIIF